ncbi:MFS transporter [Streptomyces sp. NPDC004539]|uniref:MFS transporter n=1 Tax=Streptomyces sp. NPDC004539 TaxID=3154280 RepID=UPI0033B358CB
MLVGALTAGSLTDRLGRRRMLVAGVVLFSAGSAICASAGGVGLLGAGRFVAQVTVYAATGTVYRAGERAAGLGWVTGVGRTGGVVGPWLIGALVANGDQSLGFTAFALAGLVGAVAIAIVPLARRPAPHDVPAVAGA